MILFESFLIALSTYSTVPVPQFDWNDRNMKYAICFFPAVGLVCGAALWGWTALSKLLDVSGTLFSAVAVCIPILISGGIHMDGYMDTVDALASHQPRERKLEILKDPNCGAFAVIYAGVYLILSYGLFFELYRSDCVAAVCPAFVVSRSLSALCAVNIRNARGSGMLAAFTQDTERASANIALAAVLLLSSAAAVLISPASGSSAVLSAAVSVIIYCAAVVRQFGGVTGDTSGFFLQVCELLCLAGALLGGRLM